MPRRAPDPAIATTPSAERHAREPDRDPAVLAAFRALPPGDVYLLASKAAVVRGYDYYRQGRLERYEWDRDRARLTARVRGTRLYRVRFSTRAGDLIGECDCPAWSPDWPCKHVLCACFTTLNVLDPRAFRLPHGLDSRGATLAAQLLAAGSSLPQRGRRAPAPERAQTYEVVLDARHAPPSLVVRRNGSPIAPGWSPAIPTELIPLLQDAWSVPWSPRWSGTDPLLAYLRTYADRHPLVLETREGSLRLAWDPSTKCRSKTQLALEGQEVVIRARYEAGGTLIGRALPFRSFVADLDRRKLLLLADDRGWDAYRAVQAAMSGEAGGAEDAWWPRARPGSELRLALRDFQAAQLDLDGTRAARLLRDCVLTVDGREAEAVRLDAEDGSRVQGASYRLVLVPPETEAPGAAGLWRARLEGLRGGVTFRPSAALFGNLFRLERDRGVALSLRAQKRKAVLYRAFFRWLQPAATGEREARLREALSGLDAPSRAVKNEAHRLLRRSLAAYARPDLRLEVRGGRWELRPVDKTREASLYRIPYELFGPAIFRHAGRYDELAIEGSALIERLPELLAGLDREGFELCCEGEPVRPSRWDCSVEVGRRPGRNGLDWFELRPEIRCDGKVLDEAVWRDAVRQGGLVRTERGLLVVDADTLERLRLLADLSAEARSSRGGGVRVVSVPRLRILDWIALRAKGLRVSLPRDLEPVVARLQGFERIAAPPCPKGLRATLRAYQRDGYAWLAFLYEHRFGACLADDMGLGKTLQAIALLVAIKEGVVRAPAGASGPHLVVAPTSLLFNWEQELARFAPGLQVRPLGRNPRVTRGADVLVTSYGLLRRHIGVLAKQRFHVVVFDEAQALKNLVADRTAAARRLPGTFKLALTGTPLENHLGEYYSILDLCLPGLLGDHETFRAGLKRAPEAALDHVLRRTRPFVLRRTKAEILPDLPPKTESEVFLELTPRQKALYEQTVAQVRSTIEEAFESRRPAQARIIALTAILKLRQACLSPALLTHRADEPSPKIDFLMERLQVLLEEGHSALVFSQFTSFLDLVQAACARHGVPHGRLDGRTAAGARKSRVASFQAASSPQAFLLSLKAGGQGLNLTRATYVFHLDPWWNPAVEIQASDRAHRIGQARAVSVVRLLMRHTIEGKMLVLKQRKLELYEAVMGSALRGAGRAVLTKADFDLLLSREA